MKPRKRLKQLAWREYLPLAAAVAMWAFIVLAIGHADAARLLAAATLVRAVQMMTKLATPIALKLRAQASRAVRRQARRLAMMLQASAMIVALLLVFLIAEALQWIGQHQVAAYLPFIALGMPARYGRLADVRTSSPYFRLALTVSGMVMALVAWAAAWPVALLGLVFGAREWIAYIVLRLWPREPRTVRRPVDEPLSFAEVARYSVILGRRLIAYRLTKSLLAVFGPFGNAAARTGRGLNWHSRMEPYIPHHLGGFIGFSLLALGGAAYLAVRSGEPAAMIVAAGLFQVGAAAMNVILLWRWLPDREEMAFDYEDDED